MTPLMKVGLLLNCFEALDNVTYDEKQASAILDLPQNQITEEILPYYMEALGNEIAKNAEAFKDTLSKHAAAWYKGYAERLSSLGVDNAAFEKQAQQWGDYNLPAYAGSAMRHYGANQLGEGIQQATGAPQDKRIVGDMSDLGRKLFGDSLGGTLATTGLYMIPGVGTFLSAADAGSDFINMFGKDLNWKQRLGYAGSGLLNAGMTAVDLLTLGTGGSLMRGLMRGGKALLGVGKGAKTMKQGLQAAKGFKGALGKGMVGASEALAKGRGATKGWMTGLAGQEGLKGSMGRMLMRGTQFGGKYGDAARAQALEASKAGKGALGRTWLGAKDIGKNFAGAMSMNLPMMGGMIAAQSAIAGDQQPQLPNIPQGGQLPQLNLPSQYNYGGGGGYGNYSSGSNLGYNSIGSGPGTISRFPHGQQYG